MAYLIDTGVLLRVFDRTSPDHSTILRAISVLYEQGEDLLVAPQNIAEFWNVSTRPKDKNGFGLPVESVAKRLRVIERFVEIVPETLKSYDEWKRLVKEKAVLGAKVHDARLVSIMRVSSVANILTLNAADFRRYDDITPLSPAMIATN